MPVTLVSYNMVVNKILILLVFIIAGLLGILLAELFGQDVISTVLRWEGIKKIQELPFVEEIQKEVNLPGGLRGSTNDPDAYLTTGGTIEWTNRHRAENGLAPLREDPLLVASAQKKLEDMFQKQYFAHNAPDGTTPGQVIESVGYKYITTGENLALGNFSDDQELVQAWMDSPGHKANILNTRYSEIGVAVGKGVYDGQEVWIAVQHFGKPYSSCPEVDPTAKAQIDANVNNSRTIQKNLDKLRTEIESEDPKTEEELEAHNEKVNRYNDEVKAYNALIAETKSLTDTYNEQVRAFNSCADEGK